MRSVRTKPHGKIRQRWLPASKRLLTIHLPIIAFTALVLCGTAFPATATKPLTAGAAANSAIVIGFVGGFVHSNDTRHAEVQLAEKLRTGYSGRAHVSIFENHHRDDAYNAVQENAMAAWESDSSFQQRVAADTRITKYLDARALAYTFDLQRQLRYVDAIFSRVFGEKSPQNVTEKSAASSAAKK